MKYAIIGSGKISTTLARAFAKRFVISLLALTILIGTPSFAQSPSPAESNTGAPASTASDTVDVQHVIDAYHEAVLTHDGSRLAHLFLPQSSVWLSVLSDDAYASVKAKSPDAVKIRVGSYTDFAKLVSTSKASFNPTHTHLQVNSDGTIASVYFDFVFLVDGKEQNRGSETWVLVKGTDGWRIATIIYSSNPHIS
jgi:ketosteroid isomerase-like protein